MDESLDQLRGELAEMRARIAKLESEGPTKPERPLRSRRQMLKLAGASLAGAAAAAAGLATRAVPGLAASGGNTILGGSSNFGSANAVNTADAATEIEYINTTTPGVGFLSQIGTTWSPVSASYPSALAGWTTVGHTPNGVYGYTEIVNGKALVGFTATSATGGVGVLGRSNAGYGGQFQLGSSGKAHLLLTPGSTAGAPAPAGHVAGELFVDSAGVLYYFNAGAFRPLAGGGGGITTMLSAPIRLLETRVAYEDPSAGQTKPHRKLNSGETFDLPITGQVMGGISVPAGAKAVIGNVTVTGTTGGGYLTLFPLGATQPNASSINYGAGATVANGVIVGLSGAGHMAIYCYASTDVIFDASGYVM